MSELIELTYNTIIRIGSLIMSWHEAGNKPFLEPMNA